MVYRDIAENCFPGKFRKIKFLHFVWKQVKFGLNIGFLDFWFRIFRFPLDPEQSDKNNREDSFFTGNSGRNYFICFSVNSVIIKVFRGCRSRILRYPLETDNGFQENRLNTELTEIFEEQWFFLHICKFGENKGFLGFWFRIWRFRLDSDYGV